MPFGICRFPPVVSVAEVHDVTSTDISDTQVSCWTRELLFVKGGQICLTICFMQMLCLS